MIKPLNDRVLIKPIKQESVTSSGLILALSKEETPTEGIVAAVGPGITFDNGQRLQIDLSVGDKVSYSKFAGTEVEHGGESFVILPYKEIFVVLEESNV